MKSSEIRTRKDADMDRRTFVKSGVAGGAVLALGGASCGQKELSEIEKPEADAEFELSEVAVSDLQQAMESGKYSSRKITELYLDRIEKTNLQGPTLRAIIEVNPDALEIAESLDRERKEKGPRGPLHGIPIVLKDNIDTADRMTTTAGSLALEGSIPPRDSFAAQRLREAGAVLLAKSNLSEWANFRSDDSSSGWSGRGGQCRNPYVLDRNPCGSSSGSGVAASANLCGAAIGTETNGSIMCPSNANGLVGIKPTVGLVSRSGIIPISHTQDTAGPMARTVADAAAVLSALIGVDPRDDSTANSQGKSHPDYTQFLNAEELKGSRIGIARASFGFHREVERRGEEALKRIEALGATLVDNTDLETRREFGRESYQVLLYEFKADLNAYLKELGPEAPVKTLEEIIEFNEKNRDREMPFFGQDVFISSQEKGPLSSKEYVEALAKCRRLSRQEGIDKVMDENNLDAIIAPTGGPAWVTDLINGDHFSGGSSTPAAVSGYPNITVPMGFVRGLPVGLSFFGRAWSEPKLIALAYSFEQGTKVRRAPEFIPALDLS